MGNEAPASCPFCGARRAFIKNGAEAKPVTLNGSALSPETVGFIEETLALETKASALYSCMSNAAEEYEIKAMYERLAKVELEHAKMCVALLGVAMPEIKPESCSNEEIENFKQTLELEDHAAELYGQFAQNAKETHIRIMFTALKQAETDHIELINNYI